jgi:hypothetical protein
VHDEFAHLLAVDTFLHGRLTNPTPVMWEHFETFYELMRPTYMSMYCPAQGLALALGTLMHLPVLGSFGMVALGCAAIYWMLLAWLPRRWAFLGGMLAATHPEIFNLGQGYWTGGVSFLGGALLGGVVARLMTRPARITWRHGVIAGIALTLLAYHRPFEGLVTLLLMLIAAAIMVRHKPGVASACWRAALAASVVLAPAAGWLMYYNWQITGHATELPQFLYEQQYTVVPAFYWLPTHSIPVYRSEELGEMPVDFYYAAYRRLGTVGGFAKEMFRLLRGYWPKASIPGCWQRRRF